MSAQDAKLLIHLKQLEQNPVGYRALHCHISALPNNLRTRDNLSQAVAVLRSVSRTPMFTNIFLVQNLELVLVCRDVEMGALRAAYAADPLSALRRV